MPTRANSHAGPHVRWSRGQGGLVAVGALLLTLGLGALLVPLVFGLATALVLGVFFLIGGLAQVAQAVTAHRMHHSGWRLAFGALRTAVGLFLVLYPGAGAVALTALLAGYFVIAGAAKTVSALELQGAPRWGWLLFDGLASAALGLVAWTGFPRSSAWLTGTLLGIELLLAGASMVAAGVGARSRTRLE